MPFELEQKHWTMFFQILSGRRYEWETEVEVLSPELGDQTLSRGLPLNGITIETAGNRTAVDISVGETPSHHQTHMIMNPARIAYLAGDDDHSEVVDIEEANGTKTLIRFTRPVELVVGAHREFAYAAVA